MDTTELENEAYRKGLEDAIKAINVVLAPIDSALIFEGAESNYRRGLRDAVRQVREVIHSADHYMDDED